MSSSSLLQLHTPRASGLWLMLSQITWHQSAMILAKSILLTKQNITTPIATSPIGMTWEMLSTAALQIYLTSTRIISGYVKHSRTGYMIWFKIMTSTESGLIPFQRSSQTFGLSLDLHQVFSKWASTLMVTPQWLVLIRAPWLLFSTTRCTTLSRMYLVRARIWEISTIATKRRKNTSKMLVSSAFSLTTTTTRASCATTEEISRASAQPQSSVSLVTVSPSFTTARSSTTVAVTTPKIVSRFGKTWTPTATYIK